MTEELYNEMRREAETDPELARWLEEYDLMIDEEEGPELEQYLEAYDFMLCKDV